MIGLVAIIKAKPGCEEEVSRACAEMAEEVNQKEPDCLLYEAYYPIDGGAETYILEKYVSLEALDLHRKTDHYLAFRDRIKDLVSEPPDVTVLKPV